MWKRSVYASLVILGVLIAGLITVKLIVPRLIRKPSATPARPAVPVPEITEVTLTGRVEPVKTALLAAPIDGIFDAWFVEIGQEVYRDQLLGRVRNVDLDEAVHSAEAAKERAAASLAQFESQEPEIKLEISTAEADQSRARAELDRLEKIYQRQKLLMDAEATARLTFEKSERDYETAKSEAQTRDVAARAAKEKAVTLERDIETARISLAQQSDALEKTKAAVAKGDLHSPADGILFIRHVQPGERVDQSMKDLVTVATDLSSFQAVVTPDPQALARIRTGQQAFVRLPESAEELPGTVREIRGPEAIISFATPQPVTKLPGTAQVKIKF